MGTIKNRFDGMTPEEIYNYAINDERSKLLLTLHEIVRETDLPNIFIAFINNEVHAVPPERLEGVFDAIKQKYEKMYDFSFLKEKDNEINKYFSEIKDIAEYLNIDKYSTLEEIKLRIDDIKSCSNLIKLETEINILKKSIDSVATKLGKDISESDKQYLCVQMIDRIHDILFNKVSDITRELFVSAITEKILTFITDIDYVACRDFKNKHVKEGIESILKFEMGSNK